MPAARHGRSGRGRRSPRELNARINVTPLVDVMLVLLIVFMISATLLNTGVALDLPKTDAKSLPAPQDPLTISIKEDGEIYLQETLISLEELTPKLIEVAKSGFDERIYLRGDENGDYGPVMKVMSSINAAGFTNIALVTEPAPKQ